MTESPAKEVMDSAKDSSCFEPETKSHGKNVGTEGNDSEPEVKEDGMPDDLARPALTLKEAAVILGKSLRSLERSVLGRWGNKLPDGWIARKVRIDTQEEWRIIPPESFKVRHRQKDDLFEDLYQNDVDDENVIAELLDHVRLPSLKSNPGYQVRRSPDDELGQSTIIIDRSEEVEKLLKELVKVHQALAEETRQHVDDLRLLNEMTNSVRLLETNQSETARLKEELVYAQKELISFKNQYQEYLSLPWWKRIFRKFP